MPAVHGFHTPHDHAEYNKSLQAGTLERLYKFFEQPNKQLYKLLQVCVCGEGAGRLCSRTHMHMRSS